MNAMLICLRGIIALSAMLNRSIGNTLPWLLPMMTILTLFIIVCGLFRSGWVWLGETVVYMHGILFMLSAAYTLHADAHVRIDVIYGRLSARGKAWINLGGALLLLLPTCAIIGGYSLEYVAASWAVWEHSAEGDGLPAVFLLKTCLPLAAALLLLESLAIAAKSWLILRQQS